MSRLKVLTAVAALAVLTGCAAGPQPATPQTPTRGGSTTAAPLAEPIDRFAPQPVPLGATKPGLAWETSDIKAGMFSDLGYYDPSLKGRLLLAGDEMGIEEAPATIVDLATGKVLSTSRQPLRCLPRPLQGNVVCQDQQGMVSVLSTNDLTAVAGPKQMGAIDVNSDTIFSWESSGDEKQEVSVTAYDAALQQKWQHKTSFTTIVATEAWPQANEQYFVFPQVALPSGGPFVLDAKTGAEITDLAKGSGFLIPGAKLFVSGADSSDLYLEDGTTVRVAKGDILPSWQADRKRPAAPVLYFQDQANETVSIQAVDSAGKQLWTKEVRGAVHAFVGGAMILQPEDMSATAVDPATGKDLWRVDDFVGAAFGNGDGTAILRTTSGVTAVDARSGAKAWDLALAEGSQVAASQSGLLVATGGKLLLYAA